MHSAKVAVFLVGSAHTGLRSSVLGCATMIAHPWTVQWDGMGMPPDGGDYEEISPGTDDAHFRCRMCPKAKHATWGHCNSERHLVYLTHYLKTTGHTPHLLPQSQSSIPHGMTMQAGLDGRLRMVPGPPPGEPFILYETPPPPPPAAPIIPLSRQMLMLETRTDDRMEEMAHMVRAMEARVTSLASGIADATGGSTTTEVRGVGVIIMGISMECGRCKPIDHGPEVRGLGVIVVIISMGCTCSKRLDHGAEVRGLGVIVVIMGCTRSKRLDHDTEVRGLGFIIGIMACTSSTQLDYGADVRHLGFIIMAMECRRSNRCDRGIGVRGPGVIIGAVACKHRTRVSPVVIVLRRWARRELMRSMWACTYTMQGFPKNISAPEVASVLFVATATPCSSRAAPCLLCGSLRRWLRLVRAYHINAQQTGSRCQRRIDVSHNFATMWCSFCNLALCCCGSAPLRSTYNPGHEKEQMARGYYYS